MEVTLAAEMEMEAAEALAGLARGVPGRKRRAGNGKRRIKVVEEEEPAKVESSPVDSARARPDLVQMLQQETSGGHTGKLKMEVDGAAFPNQECATALRSVAAVQVKTEQDSTFPDHQNQMCSMRYLPLGGDRSRHNFNEAEKEAKRIRRVLANRESARRTIRRRQALCEDLTSRAGELTEENRRLKKTKELALKENESLETTNRNLKALVASTELNPALWNAPASSSKLHSLANVNHHKGASDAAQATPTIAAPSLCRRDLPHEQEKLLNMAGPRPPVYMVQCPWFAARPSSSLGLDNRVDDLPVTVKTGSPDFIVGDLNEAPIESPPIGSSSPSDGIPKFAKLLELASGEASPDSGASLDLDYGSSESVKVRSSNQENIQQSVSLGKKSGDGIAATDARCRRREITRLKSIDGRQC